MPLEGFRLRPGDGASAARWSWPYGAGSTTPWPRQGRSTRGASPRPRASSTSGGSSSPAPASGFRPSATVSDFRARGRRSDAAVGRGVARGGGSHSRNRCGRHAGRLRGGSNTPPRRSTWWPGPWHEYCRTRARWTSSPSFAMTTRLWQQRYLDATDALSRALRGHAAALPYASFALVENFWETGYGMPGFTLLGPAGHPFPVDPDVVLSARAAPQLVGQLGLRGLRPRQLVRGSDRLHGRPPLRRAAGRGATYRRATLKKFTDFVSARDRTSRSADFRSRRSAASEAVGYGKSLMLFHMVRRAVGDEAFSRRSEAFTTAAPLSPGLVCRPGRRPSPRSPAAIGGRSSMIWTDADRGA